MGQAVALRLGRQRPPARHAADQFGEAVEPTVSTPSARVQRGEFPLSPLAASQEVLTLHVAEQVEALEPGELRLDLAPPRW